MTYSRPYNFRPFIPVTASKTFTLDDAFTVQQCTNSAAITLTLPTEATAALPPLCEIEIIQEAAGSVTIAAATGVTIRRIGSTATTGHIIVGQYGSVAIRKITANDWRIYGAVS